MIKKIPAVSEHKGFAFAVSSYLLAETRAVVELEKWLDVQVFTFPVRSGKSTADPGESLALNPIEHGGVRILGEGCLDAVVDGRGDLKKQSKICFAMIYPSGLVEQLLCDKAYLVTPGWLATWPKHLKTLAKKQKDWREIFAEAATKVVLLDTLVAPDAEKQLAEFCHYTGQKGERIAVGLDHYRLFLSQEVLTWRLKNAGKRKGDDRATCLTDTKRYIQELFANLPFAYCSLTGESTMGFVNKAWQEMLQYSSHKIRGESFKAIVVPDYLNSYRKFLEELVLRGKAQIMELGLVQQNGDKVLVQVSGVILPDYHGEKDLLHFFFVDLSGQSRYRELMLQSEKLLTISGFAAGIAHEINTPLSGILQSSQLIEMFLQPDNKQNIALAKKHGVDLEDVAKYLSEQEIPYFFKGIRQSAVKASEIIDSLLEFSRPTKSSPEPVRLARIIDTAVHLTLTDYEMKKRYNVMGTRFEKECDPLVPVFYCVSTDLEQVMVSLLKNAVYAMHKAETEKPCIVIRSFAGEEKIRVEVEDNGPGISHEVRRHAFDPFYTTREPGVGTGLGLSIAYAIINESYHGRIWIDPDYTAGAKIVIELPTNVDISRS